MIRQNQIRQHARFVDETAEAGDERNLLERFSHAPRSRRRKNGIALVQQQDFRAYQTPLKDSSSKSLKGSQHHAIALRQAAFRV